MTTTEIIKKAASWERQAYYRICNYIAGSMDFPTVEDATNAHRLAVELDDYMVLLACERFGE